MTDTELVSKLAQKSYSEKEMRLAKDFFHIGRGVPNLYRLGKGKKQGDKANELSNSSPKLSQNQEMPVHGTPETTTEATGEVTR